MQYALYTNHEPRRIATPVQLRWRSRSQKKNLVRTLMRLGSYQQKCVWFPSLGFATSQLRTQLHSPIPFQLSFNSSPFHHPTISPTLPRPFISSHPRPSPHDIPQTPQAPPTSAVISFPSTSKALLCLTVVSSPRSVPFSSRIRVGSRLVLSRIQGCGLS